MAYYVININERTKTGRAIKKFLKSSGSSFFSMDEFEKAEEKAFMKEMKKNSGSLFSADETRKILRQLKNNLSE